MRRVVVTGMAIHTPLADTLDGTLDALLEGRSAIARWRTLDVSRCYAKIGADLGDYDRDARARVLAPRLPGAVADRMHRLLRRVPHAPGLGVLLAAGATADAGLEAAEAGAAHVVVSGHNLADAEADAGFARFSVDPAELDALTPPDPGRRAAPDQAGARSPRCVGVVWVAGVRRAAGRVLGLGGGGGAAAWSGALGGGVIGSEWGGWCRALLLGANIWLLFDRTPSPVERCCEAADRERHNG